MRYVLLLRGINVGGNNRVVMKELKEQLTKVGFQNVSSYINSGNLFFETELERTAIIELLNQLFETHYSFDLKYSLIDVKRYLAEFNQLPIWWQEKMARKDVLFFTDEINREAVISKVSQYPLHNEKVHFGEIAIYWGKLDEAEFLKTAYHKQLAKESFYLKSPLEKIVSFITWMNQVLGRPSLYSVN
ncbi:MAG TPA: DUF1697 domain-containing protein [Globicatella sulfidifaciens]|nr:DUF1697 domain-containing protein [Globicatella sulfidifaciens]